MKHFILFLGFVFIVGCGNSTSSKKHKPTIPDKFTLDSGRLLVATNCFQCHGTNGYSTTKWDSIAGEDADEFDDDHPIMMAQTQGFGADEVKIIFNYLQNLKEDDD